jgi:hypothetical protein
MTILDATDPQTNTKGEQRMRKTYSAPSLKEYGRVSDLTMGGTPSTNSDHGSNNKSPFNN